MSKYNHWTLVLHNLEAALEIREGNVSLLLFLLVTSWSRLLHLLGDAWWPGEVLPGGERTIAANPKEVDDTVHTIWKVPIQSNPKYFGESMHLIVTAWLQTAVMILEKKVYVKKTTNKQQRKNKK